MKLKKNHIIIAFCAIIALCAGVIIISAIYKMFFYKSGNAGSIVTRGQAAKAVSMLTYDKNRCDQAENMFDDRLSGEWYVKYMNSMYELGIYDIKAMPATERSSGTPIDYGDVRTIIDRLGIRYEDIGGIEKKSGGKKVSASEWSRIYGKIVDIKGDSNVTEKELAVVGTVSNVVGLQPWVAATDSGKYGFEGLALDYYIDTGIKVYISDGEIVCVAGVSAEKVMYKNSWIISNDGKRMTAYLCGITREFDAGGISENIINTVADITVINKKVRQLDLKKETISGKVLSSNDSYVEIDGYGRIPLAEGYKIYKIYGNLEEKSLRDVVIGYDSGIFTVADGKINAIVIDKDINAGNIRVLIRTTGFKELFHEKVTISSSGGMTVTYGDNTITAGKNEKITIETGSGLLASGRVKFESNDIKGIINVDSINRSYGIPAYRGSIEVAMHDKGLVIVNELPLEEYLYGVVPSEMPASYPDEALKAQAVCARTYAYSHLFSNTYNEYGAHVDDSTLFQVYNNTKEQESSSRAVNDTYGKILVYNGEPVSAYFFSTSCGATADGTIWGSDAAYIRSVFLGKDGQTPDLTKEDVFSDFIKKTYNCYEKDFAWYRWNVTMTLADITNSVNSVIGGIYDRNNNHVLTLDDNGNYVKSPVESIGTVREVKPGRRGNGGILEELILVGSERTVKVLYQSNVRKLLNPGEAGVKKSDGSVNKSLSTLPSAFFTAEPVKEGDKLTAYIFYGGGYGHGAGMSQNGAKAMADELYKYEDILNKFYRDVKLSAIY